MRAAGYNVPITVFSPLHASRGPLLLESLEVRGENRRSSILFSGRARESADAETGKQRVLLPLPPKHWKREDGPPDCRLYWCTFSEKPLEGEWNMNFLLNLCNENFPGENRSSQELVQLIQSECSKGKLVLHFFLISVLVFFDSLKYEWFPNGWSFVYQSTKSLTRGFCCKNS